MSLVLQLSPDLEATLAAEARSRGLSLDEYVRTLIEHRPVFQPERKLTAKEFQEALDVIGAHFDKVPNLPPEALTREGIYRDHD